jgi:predicted transcriptional regulator
MQRLTKAEEEIMNMLWEQGETSVSALIAAMDEPHPPHSSISSIIRILEKKEFVDHRAEGRSFVYFPIVAKKDYSRYSLRRLITNYFDGSMNELVSFLVKEEDLSIKELEAIRKKLQTEEE